MVKVKKSSSKPFDLRNSREPKSIAQKIVVAVIVLLVLIVTTETVFALNYNDEKATLSRIHNIATSYYEDYFYPNIFSGNVSMSEILSPLKDTGFTRITLRQLIMSSPAALGKDLAFLRTHCDEDATYVVFYPEEPYDKTAYHTEFTYSCNF